MIHLTIFGKAVDLRTNTRVVYAQTTVKDYLELVGKDFKEFPIQRRREKHRAYLRMKQDIIEGALLPAITLAVTPQKVKEAIKHFDSDNTTALEKALSQPSQVKILDGLQRTYILDDLKDEGVRFKREQKVLLEFWLEADQKHLIYRIIVLNAGQKPMSMRHQVELLFVTLKEKIESNIPDLELYSERDTTRRRGPRKYALDRLATAYQSFLTRTPETTRDNLVAKQLVEGEILDASEDDLNEKFEAFEEYLKMYAGLDDEICRIYNEANEANKERGIPTGANWFGGENVMNSFFAAIADFGISKERRKRINDALKRLLATLKKSVPGDDPLALEQLQAIVNGFNPRKVNIGTATRKLLFGGFKEYFREEGEKIFRDCWIEESGGSTDSGSSSEEG
ncbi:MAG TPA: hypothetical protein VF794_40895 [Archangium sp.]|jgi:hypothetical protein|uniref:hypothetical protein n=1 Tax=Archangium sp. TaxID=1872627 RepID=UPI002EDB52F8